LKMLQGVLNWVGRPSPGQEPFKFEARLYDTLFRGEDPSKLGNDWIQDLNPASRTTVRGAMGTTPIAAAEVGTRYIPACFRGSRVPGCFVGKGVRG